MCVLSVSCVAWLLARLPASPVRSCESCDLCHVCAFFANRHRVCALPEWANALSMSGHGQVRAFVYMTKFSLTHRDIYLEHGARARELPTEHAAGTWDLGCPRPIRIPSLVPLLCGYEPRVRHEPQPAS